MGNNESVKELWEKLGGDGLFTSAGGNFPGVSRRFLRAIGGERAVCRSVGVISNR